MPTPSVLERLRAAEAARAQRERALALPEALSEFATNTTGVGGPDYDAQRRSIADQTTGAFERELRAEEIDREAKAREAAAAQAAAPADDFDRAVFGQLAPEGVDLSSIPRSRLYEALPTLGKLAEGRRSEAEARRREAERQQTLDRQSREDAYRRERDTKLDARAEARDAELARHRQVTEEGQREARQSRINKTTADQAKAAGFARRLEQAEAEMGDIAGQGYDRTDTSAGLGTLLPNLMRSGSAQRQDQAERNFVNALLRLESGAAISPGEFQNAALQYFPRAGDTPEVVAQKARNRQQAIENLKAAAGEAALGRVPEVGGLPEPTASTSEPSIEDLIAERNRRRGGQ